MTIENRILSFDIETSSLDPRKGFVWQSGFASFNNGNIEKSGSFFDPEATINREAALRGSRFGEKQFQAGAFAQYLASTNNQNQEQFITSVVDKLLQEHKSGKDILLIQNANFERRWLEDVAFNSDKATEDLKRLNSIMSHSYAANNIPSFHPAPNILELRNSALGNYYNFLKTGNDSSFAAASSAYENIISEYKSYFSSSDGKLKVIDMMDVSRGLLFKLADKGLIDKNMSLIGTSQSFLSDIFLDRPEKHLAPDDAADALEIFSKNLFTMYDEVSSGNISQASAQFISQLKSKQPLEARKQFIKSMVRAVDEGSSNYGYRYSGKIGIETEAPIEFRNNQNNTTEVANRSFRNGFLTLKTETDLDLILSDVADRYHGVSFDQYSAQTILDDILSKGTNQEKIAHLASLEDATILPDMADDVDSPGIWSYIKQNKIKSIAGIGAAIGIGSILFSDDTEQASIDRRNAEAATSLEKSLKIYNTIPQYHGSGFANWNERTKHHYY